MRTAQEWLLSMENYYDPPDCCCTRCKQGVERFVLPADIHQIQLEAFKAGMTEAARIVSATYEIPFKGEKVGPIANLILRVRDVKASL